MPVRLFVETPGGVERAVRDGHARIGVGSRLHMDMTGFRRIDVKGVHIIPVAALDHPLVQARQAALPQARDFVQLVLSEQPVAENENRVQIFDFAPAAAYNAAKQ